MPADAEKIRRAVVSKHGGTGTTGRKISDPEKTPHEKIEPGTVIGVDRGLYKHYGIYTGRGSIIHYASRLRDFGDEMSVRKTGVKHFLNGAANFFVCEFPGTHGRPLEFRRNADILGALASAFGGGGPLTEPGNPLTLLVDIFELFKKFNYKLYSPAKTLRRAKSRLGKSSYNLVFNNCEHLVVWCKTGVSESHQVNEIINTVSGRR